MNTIQHVQKSLQHHFGSDFYGVYIVEDIRSGFKTLHIRMNRQLPSVKLEEAQKEAQRILDENQVRWQAILDWGEYL